MSMPARQVLPIKTSRLCAVVPAYNERRNLEGLLSEFKALSVPGIQVDPVVVDDGSTDSTGAYARSMGVKTLSLPFNVGIGAAVQTGFQFALKQNADFVAQVDGDGQHIPGEITKLLERLHEGSGADVVVGSRYLDTATSSRTTTFVRQWAGCALSWVLRVLTGAKITDPTSGFRVYNRKAAEFISQHYPDDYPEAEALVTLLNQGFKVVEVPVKMRARQHGKSTIHGWRPLYYMLKVIFSSFMHKVRG